MRRTEAAAEDSLAAILARIRLGMAIAAMIKMMATTIRSSISENPLLPKAGFCFEAISIACHDYSTLLATAGRTVAEVECQ